MNSIVSPYVQEHHGDAQRKLMVVLALLVVAHALVYWIMLAFQYPSVPLSILTIFRRGGDPDYYPMIATLAQGKVGEIMVLEKAGTGVMSFPIASMAIHGLAVRVFGAAGYIVADALVAILFFAALAFLLKIAGTPAPYAALISFLITTCYDFAGDLFFQAVSQRFTLPLQFWGPRLPRPYVSEIFVVVILALQILIVRAPDRRYRAVTWCGLGAAFAGIVQCDFHFALILGLGIMLQVIALFFTDVERRRQLIRCVLVFAVVAAVCTTPFVLQRMFELPDVPVRYGVFPVSRLHPLTNWGSDAWRVLVCVTVIVLAATVFGRSGDSAFSGRRKSLALFSALVLLAYMALPLSCLLLGKAVQVYHFRECLKTLISYVILIIAVWFVADLVGAARGKAVRLAAVCAIIVAVAIHAIAAVAMRPYAIASRAYVWNLGRLARELSTATYRDCRVLGALDYPLATWWLATRHDYLYVPLNLGTTVDDATLETRLARFCKLMGMKDDEFIRWIRTPNENSRWLGSNKYTASKAYAMRPLVDYAPEDQARIAATSVDKWSDSWNLALPLSEQKRLAELFAKVDSNVPADERLDLIVMSKTGEWSRREPPAAGFAMTFENDEFRVWRRVISPGP